MYTMVIRTIILFFVIIITMRLMGKRQIGELQPFEFVTTIMVSELAALPISDSKIPLIYGIIPITTLIFLQVLLSLVQLKSEKARSLFCGRPSTLIKQGKIDINEVKKQQFTIDDLLEALRIQGYYNLDDIEYAILETCGQLSVILKTGCMPATKDDMKVQYTQDVLPFTLIVDGNLRAKNLKSANKNNLWLKNQLKTNNINSYKEIFVAIMNSQNKFYMQRNSPSNSRKNKINK